MHTYTFSIHKKSYINYPKRVYSIIYIMGNLFLTVEWEFYLISLIELKCLLVVVS